MPLYDFECPNCGKKHERLTDATTTWIEQQCSNCEEAVVMDKAGVQKASFRINGYSEANLYGLKG